MTKFKAALLSSLITFIFVSATFAFIYYDDKSNEPTIKVDDKAVELPDYKIKPVEQRQKANDEIFSTRRNIITNTVEKTSRAVVGVNVTEIRQYAPYRRDPIYRYFFGDRVFNQTVKSLGSGCIISPDGYILTNDHVAGNGKEIIVTMTDGQKYDAKIIGSDKASDVCLLKIDAQNLPYVKLGNSDEVIIGEWVIALGNPFGLFEINDKPTVTVGVISNTGMNLGEANERYYPDMIQTDAAINGGNSGGPLVNSLGELIGMNTLIYTASGSQGNVGVGFAIPINKVKKIIEELKTNGEVNRNFWTGLRIQSVDEDIAKFYELPSTKGVVVTNIIPGSPADRAGLKIGDNILKMGRYPINDDNTLISVLYEFRTGDTVKIKAIREGEPFTTEMKLEKREQ